MITDVLRNSGVAKVPCANKIFARLLKLGLLFVNGVKFVNLDPVEVFFEKQFARNEELARTNGSWLTRVGLRYRQFGMYLLETDEDSQARISCYNCCLPSNNA